MNVSHAVSCTHVYMQCDHDIKLQCIVVGAEDGMALVLWATEGFGQDFAQQFVDILPHRLGHAQIRPCTG